MQKSWLRKTAFIGALLSVVFIVQCQSDSQTKQSVDVENEWVGSKKCQSCHSSEYDLWKESHHYHAMHPATAEFVLGDFENVAFEADGVQNLFYREGDEYWVSIVDHGREQDFKIEYTFGWTPLQQYLVSGEKGRLQTLRATWDTEQKKWFHQNAGDEIDIEDWFHWQGPSMTWNSMCADCHSTNLSKNYFAEQDSFNTIYSEVSVGCESCHGPSAQHLKFQEEGIGEDQDFRLAKGALMPEMVDACGPCHSRRSRLKIGSNFTGSFENEYRIQNLSNQFYHADGQIREEDYVLASFQQSEMYHQGVKCTDCHDAHSYQLKLEGNQLCGQCHEPKYDSAEHHFHQNGSAQCIDCHMTGEVYMGNDFRRDHSFRVPRPDQSVQYETPNACENCHADMSNLELSNQIVEWYGAERQDHFSDGLLMASELDPSKSLDLIKFVRDEKRPELVRATAVAYLFETDFSNEPIADSLYSWAVECLNDPSYLVRMSALDAFLNYDQASRLAAALPRLNDSVRAVRIVAARLTEDANLADLNSAQKEAWQRASKEYMQYLVANSDFREGRSLLGEHYFRLGEYDHAKYWWERALESDPIMFAPKFGLAILYAQEGDIDRSIQLLIEMINQNPNDGELWYRLGLAYAEKQNWNDCAQAFMEALNVGFESASLYANLGLAYIELDDCGSARRSLEYGLTRFPNDAQIVQNLNYIIQKCN